MFAASRSPDRPPAFTWPSRGGSLAPFPRTSWLWRPGVRGKGGGNSSAPFNRFLPLSVAPLEFSGKGWTQATKLLMVPRQGRVQNTVSPGKVVCVPTPGTRAMWCPGLGGPAGAQCCTPPTARGPAPASGRGCWEHGDRPLTREACLLFLLRIFIFFVCHPEPPDLSCPSSGKGVPQDHCPGGLVRPPGSLPGGEGTAL